MDDPKSAPTSPDNTLQTQEAPHVSGLSRSKLSQRREAKRCVAERDGDRDHPLGCHWRLVAADEFAALKLPPVPDPSAIVRAQILAEAYIVGRAEPDRWISYSRRRKHYADHRSRYRSRIYTYRRILWAVEHLAELGLLDHQKMSPGSLGRQSRFKASHVLLELLKQTPLVLVQHPNECIILRDQDKKPVPYDDNAQTRKWRRNLEKINAALLSATIGLKGRPVREGDPLSLGGVNIGAATPRLHRIFNQSNFEFGGRFYGGWWQNIPSEYRADITINGAPTVEIDYPRLHPSLLYAICGHSMMGDPYDIPDIERRLVKRAFNTLVNADTRIGAIRAIARKIGGKGAFAKAADLVSQIQAKHAPVAHNFGSGAGRRLMRRDSDMTEYLLLCLLKRGIVALPVHDSYIVEESAKGALLEAMAKALEKCIKNNAPGTLVFSNNVPQDGAPPAAAGVAAGASVLPSLIVDVPLADLPAAPVPAGSVVVFFPEFPPGGDLGSTELAVLASHVLSWRGGIAPAGVQQALRHEMQRRSLPHTEVADRMGVSSSQFADILQGRFAASAAVASRIREFLVEGAETVGISIGHPAPIARDAAMSILTLGTDPHPGLVDSGPHRELEQAV